MRLREQRGHSEGRFADEEFNEAKLNIGAGIARVQRLTASQRGKGFAGLVLISREDPNQPERLIMRGSNRRHLSSGSGQAAGRQFEPWAVHLSFARGTCPAYFGSTPLICWR